MTFALCLVGLGAAGYLTYAHFTSPEVLACSEAGIINCARVTTSKWSSILSVPVALIGLVYFIALSALCSPWAWRSPHRWIHRARIGVSVAGVGMVLWLLLVEFGLIGKICLWCSVVHLMTVSVFTLVMLYGIELARDGIDR